MIEEKVEFVIVGAFAVGLHAVLRATANLDVLVQRNESNAARVRQALSRFGVTLEDSEADKRMQSTSILQLGVAPFRIDVLTSLIGVANERIFSSSVKAQIGGRIVGFIGRDALIEAKRAAARPKDLADLASWEEFNR